MKINANAKINLGLDVLCKREDGYHEVSMIMQEISLCDKIEITPNTSGKIKLEIKNSNLPTDEGNIATRAAKLFFEKTGIDAGCDIILEKNIPVCAGLGGGSSDGAAVLRALNQIYNSPLNMQELLKLGLSLGADVPFCIMGGTAIARGIGEKLTPVKSKLDFWVCLIKPDIDISTSEAYKKIDTTPFPHPDIKEAADAVVKGDINTFSKHTGNAFEYACCSDYKEINIIKNHLKSKGAIFQMMSGSGPTVFGLFASEHEAQMAFNSYKGSFGGGGVCKFINNN